MPKVSVIVPVYNGEQYLTEAVGSIRKQTMTDIEIILVNDQSTDNSAEICDQLKNEDDRIKVIHLEKNLGICGARNRGMSEAEGEYVAFCDNDDFFLTTLIEDNYSIAKKTEADMVKFGRKLIDVDSNDKVLREKETPLKKASGFNEQTKMDHYFYMKSKGLLMNVWNGIYRLALIKEENIFFNEFMRYGSEDADFSYRYFMAAKTIAVNPKAYYIHYRRDASSTSRKFNENKIESMMLASRSEAEIFDRMEKTPEVKARIIIEINKLIMNMYTQQLFHRDNPMTVKEKVSFLNTVKKNEHLNYYLDKETKKELAKIKRKHLPFSLAFSNNWMMLAYVILKGQFMLNNEKW
ncbi:glycosyltransferase family 2 protein [Alkalibacterium putridalgicola]|uniref:glycosyltransferase family 2 protein n=1 Tax=Alkalibacterium putridalgicola TaxID=426703 RepID=UPI0034CE6E7F